MSDNSLTPEIMRAAIDKVRQGRGYRPQPHVIPRCTLAHLFAAQELEDEDVREQAYRILSAMPPSLHPWQATILWEAGNRAGVDTRSIWDQKLARWVIGG